MRNAVLPSQTARSVNGHAPSLPGNFPPDPRPIRPDASFYADHFVLPLPPGHRFPMRKYSMLRDAVVREVPGLTLHEAPRADDAALALAHTADYIADVSSGRLDAARQREIGFPWAHEMVERSRRSAGATMAACRTALDGGHRGQPRRRHPSCLCRQGRRLLRVQRCRHRRAPDAARRARDAAWR